jgi:hypothetical protein
MTIINDAEEIKARLKTEGKAIDIDPKQQINDILIMNGQMEAVRREYQVKDRNSQMKASNVILTS